MQRGNLFGLLFILVLGTAGNPAFANHTFCVTSSGGVGSAAQLTNALNYAVTAVDETVYIHIEQGTFTLAGEQDYNQDGNDGNASLHVVGGFVPGTSCQQRTVDPANTVIQGANGPAGSFPISRLRIGQEEGELLIDGIEFKSFADGVDIWTAADSTATVRNVIVTGMSNYDGFTLGALTVETHNVTGASAIRVENCLIYGNNTPSGLDIIQQHDGDSGQVLGCTIVNNAGYGLFLGAGFVGTPLTGKFVAYNNIIRGNPSADIHALNVIDEPTVDYSDFNSITGPVIGSHNLNIEPHFVNPGNGQYELLNDSPGINKGAPAALVAGGYASTDIRGRKRVIGSRPDMGAYETLVDDTAPQTVAIVADTPTGNTLRAAIHNANMNATPTTITFNITGDGACPHYIDLGSLLEDITSDITIDGYTQPGAQANSLAPGYDGVLCIILYSNGLDHGLKTSGSGRLTVRGIEFEGFATAAIRLATGSGHIVTGNGFAALPGATANNIGVLIEGSATASQVGSYAFGDRNIFDQSTYAAIKVDTNGIGNHVIQGNYIGFKPDGSNWSGTLNKWGIYSLNSGSNTISFNFIGNSIFNAIHLTGSATSQNRIVENSLGIAPADGGNAGGGYGTCNPICLGGFPAIDIVSSAHDNFVGASGSTGGNNFIANNDGPGVWVESTAGTGNRIFGSNVIHDNDGFLAVDLGGLGATANDVGDLDTGPNKLQDYPILSQAMRIEPNVMRVSGLLSGQHGTATNYRLDFYFTDTCIGPGDGTGARGEMKKYVGFMLPPAWDGSGYLLPFSTTDIAIAGTLPKTGYIAATATDGNGNTSEIGPCEPYVDDYIFGSGF